MVRSTDLTTPTNSSTSPKSDKNEMVSWCLPSFGVLLAQEVVDVVLPDPVRPPDPHRRQLTVLNQAVHRHVRHPQLGGHFGHRHELRARLVLGHVEDPSFSAGSG